MIAIWYLNMVEVYITISTITKKWLTRIMANLKLAISSIHIYIYLRYSLPLRHGMQSLSLMMHKWVRNQQTRLDFLRVYLNPP